MPRTQRNRDAEDEFGALVVLSTSGALDFDGEDEVPQTQDGDTEEDYLIEYDDEMQYDDEVDAWLDGYGDGDDPIMGA